MSKNARVGFIAAFIAAFVAALLGAFIILM